jgi:hypothetical protein
MKSIRNCTRERQNAALSSLMAGCAQPGVGGLRTLVVSFSSIRLGTM